MGQAGFRDGSKQTSPWASQTLRPSCTGLTPGWGCALKTPLRLDRRRHRQPDPARAYSVGSLEPFPLQEAGRDGKESGGGQLERLPRAPPPANRTNGFGGSSPSPLATALQTGTQSEAKPEQGGESLLRCSSNALARKADSTAVPTPRPMSWANRSHFYPALPPRSSRLNCIPGGGLASRSTPPECCLLQAPPAPKAFWGPANERVKLPGLLELMLSSLQRTGEVVCKSSPWLSEDPPGLFIPSPKEEEGSPRKWNSRHPGELSSLDPQQVHHCQSRRLKRNTLT